MTREEAIEKVRQMSLPKETMEILETLAPELKESEDERIRKALIEALTISKSIGELKFRLPEPTREECIAWLEKQKENPMPNSTELIEMWDKEEVKLKEKDFHGDEWRLAQNAFMDGFAIGTCVKFEKQKEQPTNEEMLRILRTEYEKGVTDTITKYEQKEPKPVVTHGETYHVDTLGTQQVIAGKMPQKPAEWSDTDELVFQDICKHLNEEGYSGWVVLLNALRNGEFQPKQEWSEKDEKMRERLITRLIWITYNTRTDGTSPNITFFDEIDWLKSLRPQPHWKPSKEEIDAFENLLKGEFPNKIFPGTTLANLLNKLKKLYYNEAIQVWKPSEEQMEALAYAIQVLAPRAAKASEELENLREQLEKLI